MMRGAQEAYSKILQRVQSQTEVTPAEVAALLTLAQEQRCLAQEELAKAQARADDARASIRYWEARIAEVERWAKGRGGLCDECGEGLVQPTGGARHR